MKWIVRLLVLVSLPGCSFFTMERAGRVAPPAAPECTASVKPIVFDLLMVVASGIVLADELRTNDNTKQAIGVSAPPIVLWLASAVDGVVIRRNCQRKRAAHDQWVIATQGGGS